MPVKQAVTSKTLQVLFMMPPQLLQPVLILIKPKI
jgi:hypothetical protein